MRMEREGLFVRREGREAMVVLRKVFWMFNQGKRLDGGSVPILIVECRRPGMGAYSYEYFIPLSFSWLEGGVASIFGSIGPGGERVHLRWSPEHTEHESGTYVSCVEFLPQQREAIDSYEPPQPIPAMF